MEKVFFVIAVTGFILLAKVSAAEISVKGVNVSDTNCRYASTSTGTFQMTISGEFDWGSRVYLQYGFHDSMHDRSWESFNTREMEPVSPYVWQVSFKNVLSARGSFFYSSINFVFRVEHADGRREYIKGNDSSLGFFQAQIPTLACEQSDPVLLDFVSVEKE